MFVSGIGMNHPYKVGRSVQPRFKGDEPKEDPGVEMWKGTDSKGMTARCAYYPDRDEMEVTVSHGEKVAKASFRPLYRPTFGMDVADMAQSYELAEKLACQLEKETNR